MTRPAEEQEDELTKIWSLVSELAEQLESNRHLVNQLKSRSDNVKGQAAHVGTGFPLRRFNLDISDEEFSSELEAFSSHLVLENQQLQHENKQLNTLLKEYEQTLESVMGKFRGVAHASQQHDLSLHSYYTSLLQTLQTAHSSAHLHDNTSLSLLLHRLSTLLRSALRALSGEDAEFDLEAHLPGLLASTKGDVAAAASAASSPISPSRPSSFAPKSIRRAPPRPPAFHGSQPGASGGYTGTNGQGDWALEREMEIMRLEDENASLREMLRIAQESTEEAEVEHAEEIKADEKDEKDTAASPVVEPKRKNSLTIEELQLGAEKEDEAKSHQLKVVSMKDFEEVVMVEDEALDKGKGKAKAEEGGRGGSALGLTAEPQASGR